MSLVLSLAALALAAVLAANIVLLRAVKDLLSAATALLVYMKTLRGQLAGLDAAYSAHRMKLATVWKEMEAATVAYAEHRAKLLEVERAMESSGAAYAEHKARLEAVWRDMGHVERAYPKQYWDPVKRKVVSFGEPL